MRQFQCRARTVTGLHQRPGQQTVQASKIDLAAALKAEMAGVVGGHRKSRLAPLEGEVRAWIKARVMYCVVNAPVGCSM